MKSQALTRRYAHGLVNALKDDDEFEAVKSELEGFASLISRHEQLREVLLRPFLPRPRRVQVVRNLLEGRKLSEKTVRFAVILVENDRLGLLAGILKLLPLLWNEKKGVFTYEVTAAVPLSEAQKKRLEERLESVEKGPVYVIYTIDPELLGGLSLRKGNIIYDLSLRGHLAKLKEKIVEGQ